MTLVLTPLADGRSSWLAEIVRGSGLSADVLPQAELERRAARSAHVLFVGLWSELNPAALELGYELVRAREDLTTSFVLRDEASEIEALWSQAGSAPRAGTGEQIAIFPLIDIAEDGGEGWRVFGDLASPPAVKSGLKAGARTLLISTHGDGADARMPADLQLCCAPWEDASSEAGKPPECIPSQWCYRLKMGIAEASRHERMIVPGDLSVETLIYDSCLGMQSGNALFDPQWLLIRKLLRAGACDNLICFSGYLVDDRQGLLDLSHEIASGASPESAVAAYNRSARPGVVDRRTYLLHRAAPRRRFSADRTYVPVAKADPAPPTPAPPSKPGPAYGEVDLPAWLGARSGRLADQRLSQALTDVLAGGGPGAPPIEGLADIFSTIEPGAVWLSDPATRRGEDVSCRRCGRPASTVELDDPPIFRRFMSCHDCNYYEDSDGRPVADLDLSRSGILKVVTNEACEVRVKVTPAGEPKSVPALRRIQPPPFGTMRETDPVLTTTAYAFRADEAAAFEIDIRERMHIAPYFIAVTGMTERGYSSLTHTILDRTGFADRRRGSLDGG